MTEGTTVEGHRLNTIKMTVNEVKATVALHKKKKCTIVGDRRMVECRWEWENGNLLMRPMYGVVTMVWPLC